MANDVKQSDVTVQVMAFAELCALDYPLKLDHYQRPYVWTQEKVRQLLRDLTEFSKQPSAPAYYLGTLLLHRAQSQRAHFVIDGQQRLSSLAAVYHALTGRLPSKFDFHYRSPHSVVNLQQAQHVLAGAAPLPFDHSLFDRLCFTVITVTQEDLAFTFFDTQNNRGVPLKATDLLKAYHLRAIRHDDSQQVEQSQEHCARRWEAVQVAGAPSEAKRQDFAPTLFHQYLWRARNWCGQKRVERETHDEVLETFQQKSVENDAIDSVPLYPGHSNQFASRLYLQDSGDYRLELNAVQLSPNAANLPFTLRQPIHQGMGFFLYAQKYAALLDALLHQPTTVEEVARLRQFYMVVPAANSHYLRELFNLALLMFVDRFGYPQMLEFAHRAELVLGAVRLEKQYIFKEAPLKFLKEAAHNVLDVIAAAYRPVEVMDFLQDELAHSTGYSAPYLKKISPGKGVQGRYLSALRGYFCGVKDLPSDVSSFLASTVLNNKGNP